MIMLIILKKHVLYTISLSKAKQDPWLSSIDET